MINAIFKEWKKEKSEKETKVGAKVFVKFYRGYPGKGWDGDPWMKAQPCRYLKKSYSDRRKGKPKALK